MAERFRVVVIGGGIAGCSALYHLGLEGWTDTLLLERDQLSSGSTWHAAGNVPTYSGSWSVMKVQKYSAELYRKLAAEAEDPISYHVTGSVRLAHTDDRMAEFHHVRSMARANGMDYEMLSPADLVERYPLVETHDLKGALWDPFDGDIDPSQITAELARKARAMGATVRRNEKVIALTQRADHSWLVTTDKSEIECEILVNAAGYRAGEVMELIGRHMPIVSLSHQYLLTEDIPALAEIAERGERLPLLRDPDTSYYLRQERGGYILGPYEWQSTAMWLDGIPAEFANMLWSPDLDRLETQILDASARVPVLGDAGITRVVNGPIPYAPDGYPYVGPERGMRNFFHCNNFSFGIAQGGGAGKALAEWVIHGQPEFDLWSIDRRRYADYATTQYTVDKALEVYQNEYAPSFPFEERPAGRIAYSSPLYDTLAAAGAHFGARGGWERPTWFDPEGRVTTETLSFKRVNEFLPLVGEEVDAVRNRVAVLDLPGFTKVEITGPGATAYLDRLVCSKLPRVGRVALCYALTPTGTVLSEFTLSRLAEDHYYLCAAASAKHHDLDVLEHALPTDGSVQLRELSAERGSLVLVGPHAREVLSAVTTSSLTNADFPWLSIRDIDTAVGPVRALRVGYVGELGWELHATVDQMPALYEAIWAAGQAHGIRNFGIYAVDSLRLDKCYRGWKQDLEIGFTPFDASLDRFVDLDKGDFVGRDALMARGEPQWRFVPMVMDEAGEHDAPFCASIFDGDERIGIVTSGGWSFTLNASIALGYVRPGYATAGTKVTIGSYDTTRTATVGAEPLYDPTNARLRA